MTCVDVKAKVSAVVVAGIVGSWLIVKGKSFLGIARQHIVGFRLKFANFQALHDAGKDRRQFPPTIEKLWEP